VSQSHPTPWGDFGTISNPQISGNICNLDFLNVLAFKQNMRLIKKKRICFILHRKTKNPIEKLKKLYQSRPTLRHREKTCGSVQK